MEKCWESHIQLQTEAKLVFIKDQGWLYQMYPLRVIELIALIVLGLERVIL